MAMRVLRTREDEQLVTAETWAQVLLLAGRFGWQPNRLTYFFLADGVEVTEDESAGLALALESALTEALSRPAAFYPAEVDMAVVARLCEFFGRGGFRIDSMAP